MNEEPTYEITPAGLAYLASLRACWICHPGPCPTPADCGLPAVEKSDE